MNDGTAVAALRMQHLQRVMETRASELVSRAEAREAINTARAAGCSPGEIQSALALIERAAASR